MLKETKALPNFQTIYETIKIVGSQSLVIVIIIIIIDKYTKSEDC
jgi:hypothetical protein